MERKSGVNCPDSRSLNRRFDRHRKLPIPVVGSVVRGGCFGDLVWGIRDDVDGSQGGAGAATQVAPNAAAGVALCGS